MYPTAEIQEIDRGCSAFIDNPRTRSKQKSAAIKPLNPQRRRSKRERTRPDQESAMTSADVFAQIEKMGELPSLPRTLLRIQNVASDERSSADDLARCILKDQALTMRVLKVVNSALYQRRGQEKIRTVHRAVIVMGFETVRKLALGLSVFDMMSKLSRSPLLVDIARHSLITAGLAQILAEASGRVPPEEAFVTALVHDIGKVVLIECSPAAMDAVARDVQRGVPTLEAERRHFGISHDRAGRRLADRWQLPHELREIIGDHHDIDPVNPPRHLDPALGIIVYANAMSRLGREENAGLDEQRLVYQAIRALKIRASDLDSIHRRAREEVLDLAVRVGVEIDDLADYGSLVNADGSATVAPRRLTPREISQRTARQLEIYQQIGQGIAAGMDPSLLTQQILDAAVEVLGFERVVLLRADRAQRLLRPWAWSGLGAADLAACLDLPLSRTSGAVAMAILERRLFHVPMAKSPAYCGLVGDEVLAAARCTGFAATPVVTPAGVVGVVYADCGPDGPDVVAEQAQELNGLTVQLGLVCSMGAPLTVG
jgi:putative nucleotidyltransferase with HDIG domain